MGGKPPPLEGNRREEWRKSRWALKKLRTHLGLKLNSGGPPPYIRAPKKKTPPTTKTPKHQRGA